MEDSIFFGDLNKDSVFLGESDSYSFYWVSWFYKNLWDVNKSGLNKDYLFLVGLESLIFGIFLSDYIDFSENKDLLFFSLSFIFSFSD